MFSVSGDFSISGLPRHLLPTHLVMMFCSRLVSDAVRHFTGNDCFATARGHDDVIDHVISTSLRHSLVFVARGIFVISHYLNSLSAL